MAQGDTSLEHLKGLGSSDLNQRLVLVKSSANRLIEAITGSWQIRMLKANAYELPTEFVDDSCVVCRLRGHEWTVLELFGYHPSLDERDFACSISRSIRGETLLFEQSDTCLFIRYEFFNSGCLVESINFQEAAGMESEIAEQSLNIENNHYTLKFRYLSREKEEDYEGEEIPFEVNCCFESRLRQPSVTEIGYPYSFIENFLEEKNIYIPDFRWFQEVEKGEAQVLCIEGISSFDFEEFDFEEFYYMSFG